MGASNQSFPVSSTWKFFLLLTLTLLVVSVYTVNAQDNTNSTNSNTRNTNVNANRNSNVNADANANANQNGNANGNVNGNSNQGGTGASTDSSAERRRDSLAQSVWFLAAVTLLFVVVLVPFAYTIMRAIRFSRATYSSPLGLPEGSLRAMLAYTLVAFVGFYILASILSFSDFKPPEFLLGIVATVIGFYFGSRTGDASTATPRTGSVQGDVTDKNGTPAGGANVELSQSNVKKLSQTADANGKYKFDNVPLGDYEIQASLAGNQPSDKAKVQVTGGAAQPVNLKLK
jgi:hypothetical protein